MNKKFLSAVAALALVLMGCGGNDTPAASTTSTAATTSATAVSQSSSSSTTTTTVQSTTSGTVASISQGTTTKATTTTTKVTTTTTKSAGTTTTTTMGGSNVLYKELSNPVAPNGNDPWIIKHGDDYYYCWSGGPGVRVKRLDSLENITTDDYAQVYLAPPNTMYSAEYWAPELHYIQGEWYIYVAADDGNNDNHRMYVLKGTSQDPTDPFAMVGQITDPTNKWAIDGTVVTIENELYFVWSGWEGDVNVKQNLYIAHMSNPWTIDSDRTMISTPEYSWERVGTPKVNEGPTALYHGDDVFIVYSASGSWTDDYCLGLLTFTGGDPLLCENWKKNVLPVFKKTEGVAYGPGHCSFTTAVDGSTWMVYHANRVSGSGWNGREVWLSPVAFSKNGTPIFEDGPSWEVNFPYALSEQ